MNASRTILLVEDDSDVRRMIGEHLEFYEYRVVEARDGMEGLQRLESGQYDLVITDIVMPFVSGVGVVRAVKAKRPEIPVIAITGQGKVSEDMAAESNADLVLDKPINMAEFVEHVRRLLGEHP
ncbi:MAG: response regulator [Deltaproteobacteria bacterium]|nr:response regulator [Deltaproteobacteria bacterium]